MEQAARPANSRGRLPCGTGCGQEKLGNSQPIFSGALSDLDVTPAACGQPRLHRHAQPYIGGNLLDKKKGILTASPKRMWATC